MRYVFFSLFLCKSQSVHLRSAIFFKTGHCTQTHVSYTIHTAQYCNLLMFVSILPKPSLYSSPSLPPLPGIEYSESNNSPPKFVAVTHGNQSSLAAPYPLLIYACFCSLDNLFLPLHTCQPLSFLCNIGKSHDGCANAIYIYTHIHIFVCKCI